MSEKINKLKDEWGESDRAEVAEKKAQAPAPAPAPKVTAPTPAPTPKPPAAPTEDTRTAREVEDEIDSLRNKQRGLLLPSNKIPFPGSKARKAYDELEAKIKALMPIYDRKAAAEREKDAEPFAGLGKRKTAAPTPAPTPPAAPAPAPKAAPITVINQRRAKDNAGNDVTEVELSDGSVHQLIRLTSIEGFGLAGWHDANAKGPAGSGWLGNTKEEAIQEIIRRREQVSAAPAPTPAPTPTPPAAPAQPALQGEVFTTDAQRPVWARTLTSKMRNSWDKPMGAELVYFNGNVGLVRALPVNIFNQPIYGRMIYRVVVRTPDGKNVLRAKDIDEDGSMQLLSMMSPAQLEDLKRAGAYLRKQEDARATQYPDGPFTGSQTQVVKTENVSQRYADYIEQLAKALGLKDLRILMTTGTDLDRVNRDKYRLYGDFADGLLASDFPDNTNGSTRQLGLKPTDRVLFIKEGLSEDETLEILAHEFGHIIQGVSFDSAPATVRNEVMKEYNAWLAKAKAGTVENLVRSLRNRTNAENTLRKWKAEGTDITKPVSALPPSQALNYYLSFSEWFADNVSRWATTSDKPLTVAERFFASVAQKMRDLVKIVTGRDYLPAKAVKDFLDAMSPGSAFSAMPMATPSSTTLEREQFSLSVPAERIIEGMGPIESDHKPWYKAMVQGIMTQPGDPSLGTKFRVMMADSAAAIEQRLQAKFNGAVRDALGNLNPMGLLRQAQDYVKLLPEYFQKGAIEKDPITGLWKAVTKANIPPPIEVFNAVDRWSEKHGYTREVGTRNASRILEAMRLKELLKSNQTQGTEFLIHMSPQEIATLEAEYNADPDLKHISDLMDKARIAMVDNMVAVGRLSKAEGDAWKAVVHYVPFDRISDELSSFDRIKKLSGKGVAQLGKLPELKGSLERPVGNVFTNYMNTLGWMLRQTTNADATRTTIKVLESMGIAKPLGPTTQHKDNTVGSYVDGELRFWQVPSKYDVLAFKDLTLPKSGLMKFLGAFSNVLRTTVTALPPFALKQVADDVQRAIFTSGVRNPGPMIAMALTNFPKIALAEMRGIKHPIVRELGDLGLTGEYDFQQGRPAESLLKDVGYLKRGRFENLLHKLDGITRASDIAVRKAIYDQTKRETNDELLAQTRAREFINFRRRGASNFAAAMTSTIPFFNAYVQGMDVLYRAATGEAAASGLERTAARRLFWSRAAMLTTFATLYALGKSDDDDYKEMDLRTRDGNWILGNGLKIGVPTELGAIFKVIPERMVEYYKRKGTPEEQEAMEAIRTAVAYIAEQYVGRAAPIPQAAKPLLEAWTNFSFLTGRPLEGIFQKTQLPSERRGAATSELAIAMAAFSRDVVGAEISPIMIDNVLRGYFGSTAAMVTMATDSMLNPTRVDRPLHKYALLSNYLYDPVGTRRMSEFYEEREKVGQINATLNELAKTDPVRAEAFADKHEDALALERSINATLEQLERTRAYRKYLNSPIGAEEMPKPEREQELEGIRKMEAELTGWLREAKTEIRKGAKMS